MTDSERVRLTKMQRTVLNKIKELPACAINDKATLNKRYKEFLRVRDNRGNI